ncbi:RNA-directed DNA polymerase, eukaryota [Tanacetum coccineum]
MIIAVYAPHDPRDKRMLWDYLAHVINQWQGEVVIMGDFNEVRVKSDRFGTNFNVLGANIFNSFINSTGLEEVHLGGGSGMLAGGHSKPAAMLGMSRSKCPLYYSWDLEWEETSTTKKKEEKEDLVEMSLALKGIMPLLAKQGLEAKGQLGSRLCEATPRKE